jgi:hypothetical protein
MHMPTVLVFHDVDDIDVWVKGAGRSEIFATHGITVRPFTDPNGSNHVGLALEVPNLDAIPEILADPDLAADMKEDGVRPETMVILHEVTS